jgi:hypothetical protein
MAENDSKEKAGRTADRNERSLRLEARRAVPAKVRVVPVVPTAPGLFVVPAKVTHRRDGRSLVAVAFSPSRVAVARSRAGRKIQKLLELPPIPAPPTTGWQDASRSTSKLRLPRKNDTMSGFS